MWSVYEEVFIEDDNGYQDWEIFLVSRHETEESALLSALKPGRWVEYEKPI